MRVAFLPASTSINDPAARMRAFEVVRGLAGLGVQAEIADGGSKPQVVVLGRYQLAQAEANLALLRELRAAGTKVIFDFADDLQRGARAAFAALRAVPPPDRLGAWLGLRRRLSALRALMREADWVTVSADGLLPQAARHNRRVTVIPDVIAPEYFALPRRHGPREPVVLVWTGYLDNLAYLALVEQALARLAEKRKIEVRVITSARRRTPFRGRLDNREIAAAFRFPTCFVPWRLDEAWSELFCADIGLAPVPAGIIKSANKAATYMAMGLATVASRTTEYARLMSGGCGFLCASEQDWEAALTELVDSPALRGELGERGREAAAGYCSITAVARQWLQVFGQL